MNRSDVIKDLADAMSKFQGEVKNPKRTATNPFFKSLYTPLDVLIDTAKPVLAKHGLSYLQSCCGDGTNIIVTTLIMHNSGEWIELDPLTLKADKPTAQGAGSAITYARRYALAAALGLASEEDDDGNGAEPPKKGKQPVADPKPQMPPQAPQQTQTVQTPKSDVVPVDVISKPQRERLFALAKGDAELCKTIVSKHGYAHSADIKKIDYSKICDEIEKTIKER